MVGCVVKRCFLEWGSENIFISFSFSFSLWFFLEGGGGLGGGETPSSFFHNSNFVLSKKNKKFKKKNLNHPLPSPTLMMMIEGSGKAK